MQLDLRSQSLWRSVLPLAAALALGLGTLSILRYLAHPLALLVLAISVAEALSPLVSRLERFVRRGFAVGIVYLAVTAVFAGLAWSIVPTVLSQGEQLVQAAPALTERVRVWIGQQNSALGFQISTLFDSLPSHLGSFLVWLPLRLFRSTLQALVVVFLSIYWLFGSPGLQRFTLTLFPPDHRADAGHVLVRMGQAMGGYVRGAAINAVIMGALAWLGLSLLHVPYALTLGALTMLLEPIPLLGPILAAVPVVLIALSVSPTLALYALGLYTVLQQVEGQVLTPNIMRSQTDVPQTLVLFAVLAGGALGGLLGVLVSIPLAAAARVFVLEVLAPAVRRRVGAEPVGESPAQPSS